MKRIDASSRTIRELLDAAKFSIDSYQREYAWKKRKIQELKWLYVGTSERVKEFVEKH